MTRKTMIEEMTDLKHALEAIWQFIKSDIIHLIDKVKR